MNPKHILSVLQFTKNDIMRFIERATYLKQYRTAQLVQYPEKTLVTAFYEPSTRTSCSFQSAAYKLGCKVISITDKISSSQKGETLEDTIKTLQYYGDAIVLRHPEKGSSMRASTVSNIPIINAGDGNGEHPTQALLDIFTIYTELQKRNIDLTDNNREPITVTFTGDLKNSRTIHSLIHVLSMFPKIRFVYISPPTLEMPPEIIQKMNDLQIPQQTYSSLYDSISNTDILYVTRIQKERFVTEREYFAITLSHDYKNFCITTELIQLAKPTALVMHPLPRTNELLPEIDDDPRAVYFKQVENGVYMRMAILEDVFMTSAINQ
jgi:carbamoyl-phosphate synthase/aspartate carbamoyltransferase